jgi:ethanolamine kinase
MLAASRLGIGPRVYATFGNGLLIEYLRGKTLSVHDVRHMQTGKLVAAEMAKWHSTVVETLFEDASVRQTFERSDCFSVARTWSDEIVQLMAEVDAVESLDDSGNRCASEADDVVARWRPLHARFCALLDEAERAHAALELPECLRGVAFCHNDLTAGNIMFEVRGGERDVIFVDVESASISFPLFDVANYFCEWAGLSPPDWSRMPTGAEQRELVEHYLRARTDIQFDSDAELRRSVDAAMHAIERVYVPMSHLFWCAWGVVQAFVTSLRHFSHIDYSLSRFKSVSELMERQQATGE